jgi:hypothetical protein
VTRVTLARTLPVAVVSALCVLPLAAPFASGAPAAEPATPYGVTWTVQPGANSLSEYAPGASGADTPIATIRGAATGLDAPTAVALTKAGNLLVSNGGNNSITEYAADASGNASPVATIAGPHTGLDAPSSITVSGGTVWVTNPSVNLVESFSVGSNGDVLPAETIAGKKTDLDHPVAVAASQLEPGAPEIASSITVLNSPASSASTLTSYFTAKRGNIAPATEVTGTRKHPLRSPTALLADDFGEILVADSATNSITEYFTFPGLPLVQAVRTIAGSNTGLDAPSALSMDAFGHIVVANSGDQTVRVFGLRARGNVAPLRSLTGVGTRTGSPSGVVVFGAPPSPPTNVQVKIHHNNAKMSWQAPAVTGGGLEGYETLALRTGGGGGGGGGGIIVSGLRRASTDAAQRGRNVPAARHIGGGIGFTKKTSFTQRGIKPGRRYLFIVAAINGFGEGISRPVSAARVIPPSAPRRVRTTTSRHSIAVTWKPPKLDGGQRVRRYDVEHATCVPGAKGCTFHTRHVGATRGPLAGHHGYLRITGLNPATRYYVRVVAENTSKVGRPSRAVSATTAG